MCNKAAGGTLSASKLSRRGNLDMGVIGREFGVTYAMCNKTPALQSLHRVLLACFLSSGCGAQLAGDLDSPELRFPGLEDHYNSTSWQFPYQTDGAPVLFLCRYALGSSG